MPRAVASGPWKRPPVAAAGFPPGTVRNHDGARVPSGVYLVRATHGGSGLLKLVLND